LRSGSPVSRRLLLAFGTLSVLLTGCRQFQHVSSPEKPKARVLHLETFVLNLDDAETHSFLRVGIDLGIQPEAETGSEYPDAVLVPPVRDTIIIVLTTTKPAEIADAAGKAKLKASLVKALQERLPSAGVRDIYFTEFLIQR